MRPNLLVIIPKGMSSTKKKEKKGYTSTNTITKEPTDEQLKELSLRLHFLLDFLLDLLSDRAAHNISYMALLDFSHNNGCFQIMQRQDWHVKAYTEFVNHHKSTVTSLLISREHRMSSQVP